MKGLGRIAAKVILLAAAAAPPGCSTAELQRESADAAAAEIIETTRRLALNRSEAFTIERPSETLRRRLLLDQNLPFASSGSLGVAALEPVDYWPADPGPSGSGDLDLGVAGTAHGASAGSVELKLVDALRVAARNSRDYQEQKEEVFRAALDLDLARNEFRTLFTGAAEGSLDSTLTSDPKSRTTGIESTGTLSAGRVFQNGVSISTQIGLDVVKLLTPDVVTGKKPRSLALFGDASITIPLMRGAGRHIVAEPLIQAERNTLYQILRFERFKKTFAVDIATRYLQVLQQIDAVNNAEQNYRSLMQSVRQLRRQADAGRRSEIEVDQAVQNELQARDGWIRAINAYERQLDAFRIVLGLPPDAEVALERAELGRLGESVRAVLGAEGGPRQPEAGAAAEVAADAPVELDPPGRGHPGPFELDQRIAVEVALGNRLDLAVAEGGIFDAQRAVVVAADALRAEVTLLGSGSFGERRTLSSAALPDSTDLRYDDATYEALLTIDLPLERTAERNAYRDSWILLERTVRAYQELEDQIKQEVREELRSLLLAREEQLIQTSAVAVAMRRVDSTRSFLEAGRAQTRDLLEAQEDLVAAQNDLTAALIAYRIAEYELQRDLGVLQVSEDGLWEEFDPRELTHEDTP
ncbi:MAG: TolC family protein [Planctomycetes bacterium]|nr:TolC family protein [Planctomycetota bacterium]